MSVIVDHWQAWRGRSGACIANTGRACRLIVCAIGLVSGCAEYRAVPLKPERSANEFSARRLDAPELHDAVSRMLPQASTPWPPREFDRATLLVIALLLNPQLAVARTQVQATLAHETSATQMQNPDTTLQSEYARHDPHPWLYGLNLNWPLRSTERRLEGELARRDTDNARLQLMEQTWAVRHALTAALSDWQSAQQRLRLLDRLVERQDHLLGLEHKRIEAGEDAPSELVIAQQTRIQIDQQQAELHLAADTAQVAAAKAIGLPPDALDDLKIDWADWGDPITLADEDLLHVREQALLSRADLAVAIGEYAKTETRLQQAIARQYPQLNLGPGYYWDHGIAKFPLDVSFSVPLNQNRGEIAESMAARELAGQRMLALQADIYGAIAAAQRAERIARASVDAAQRQLDVSRQQKQQAERRLRWGAAEVQEQLGADIILIRAELEMVEARAQLQAARNALEDALHVPLSGSELGLAKSLSATVSGAGS